MDKREAITAFNLGPLVSVLTWLMAASVLLAVGIKLTLSSLIPGKRNKEDVALCLATAFSIGFSVAVSFAVPNGVGKHEDILSSYQLEAMQKAVYSADILFVLVSMCAQSSILIFLYEITPDCLHQRLIYALAGLVILAFIPSVLVALFSCHPPDVWHIFGAQCIDRLTFWEAFAGINLVIESSLVLLPVYLVYPLMMERRRKVIVISGFAARIMVIGAFAAQIFEVQSLKLHVLDRTFHAWKYILTMVFAQGLSIITVCIPYIRNLLLSMESGMIQTGHFRLQSRHDTNPEVLCELATIGQISISNVGRKPESPRTSI